MRVETGTTWDLIHGDCIEELARVDAASVDLSVYSPPFSSLFTYSASEHDIGNCASHEEFLMHMGFFIRELLRVTKPGRLTCCHIAQITSTKAFHGVIGLIDLRGAMVRAFTEAGWIYHGDICIDKDPQAQAIRTHSKALLFVQLRKDASWLRPALADYILVFRAPGDNAVPVKPDLTNDEWIEWARPIWYGIDETDTLNTAVAKENDDERHICPLQLGTIERCIRLWSNPGELVLSPFAGIGSEGYEAVRLGRRFLGIELKESYARTAVRNLRIASDLQLQGMLFAPAIS
jgi:DNA modification methylase